MTQERTSGAAGKQSESPAKDTLKKVGDFVMKPELIPTELQAFVKERLGRDPEGNPRKDEKGADLKPTVVPAKENGSYKGSIILNNENYIVQAVGREAKTAVVHRKEDVELMGSKLKWRDENKKLHNADVQIYYSGDKAKAYPWDKEKALAATAKEAGKNSQDKDGLKPENLLEKAQQYAAENIKNVKQREAFLKHLENVTQQATDRQQPEQPGKAPKAAERGKKAEKADQGIER